MQCCNCDEEATISGGCCYFWWEKPVYIPSLEEVEELDDICLVWR